MKKMLYAPVDADTAADGSAAVDVRAKNFTKIRFENVVYASDARKSRGIRRPLKSEPTKWAKRRKKERDVVCVVVRTSSWPPPPRILSRSREK